MRHIVTLSWQQSWLQSISALNQILPFVTQKREKDGHVPKIHNAHTVLSFSLITIQKSGRCLLRPKKGECHSCKKKTWKLNGCHDNITICILIKKGTLLVPSFSYNASIFPEIFLILWFFCNLMTYDIITYFLLTWILL